MVGWSSVVGRFDRGDGGRCYIDTSRERKTVLGDVGDGQCLTARLLCGDVGGNALAVTTRLLVDWMGWQQQ